MYKYLSILIGVFAGVSTAAAQTLEVEPCPSGDLSCEADLVSHIDNIVFGVSGPVYTGFFGVMFGMLVLYGFILVFRARSDDALQNAVSAYSQALIGAILMTFAVLLGGVFSTENQIYDGGTFQGGFLATVISFLVKLVGFVLVANIVVQGIRMIVAVNEGNSESARKNLLQSFVGAAIVVLAVPIISVILPGAFDAGINDHIVGIANFLATIFGFAAVLTFIVAGIMLVASVDESLKDKAKNLMIAAIVSIVVVVSALALVTILLP